MTNRLKKIIKAIFSDKIKSDMSKFITYSDVSYRINYKELEFFYISDNIEELIGYNSKEMRFTDFFSLIEVVKIEGVKISNVYDFKSFKKMRQSYNAQKWQAEYLIKTKSGKRIWLTDISYPWYDNNRNIIGVIGCLKRSDLEVTDDLSQRNNEESIFTDSITGIANEEYFFKRLDQELISSKNLNKGLSILLVDIDQFKIIEEKYGTEINNKILVKMAKIIQSCLKETDFIARLDEGEFAICLPSTSEESGYWVAERICKTVENSEFYVNENNIIKCTVSIGISSMRNNLTVKIDQLIKIADTRLYIAKNTGQNQVSIDEIVTKNQRYH